MCIYFRELYRGVSKYVTMRSFKDSPSTVRSTIYWWSWVWMTATPSGTSVSLWPILMTCRPGLFWGKNKNLNENKKKIIKFRRRTMVFSSYVGLGLHTLMTSSTCHQPKQFNVCLQMLAAVWSSLALEDSCKSLMLMLSRSFTRVSTVKEWSL